MASQNVLVACPQCGAKNRIPILRIGETGKCGRCAAPLATQDFVSDAPLDLPEVKFDAVTRLAPRPVLVDFWAAWCAPCRQLAPTLEQLAKEWSDRIVIAKLDTETAPATAARFGVQSIPTLVLLRSGIEVDRILGALPLVALQERLSRFV